MSFTVAVWQRFCELLYTYFAFTFIFTSSPQSPRTFTVFCMTHSQCCQQNVARGSATAEGPRDALVGKFVPRFTRFGVRKVSNSKSYLQGHSRALTTVPFDKVYVKYTSICIAYFYANRLKCAQTWIAQFYLQITPCLPLLPSRKASSPFGWYSFYRPTEGRRLSRPGWLVTY